MGSADQRTRTPARIARAAARVDSPPRRRERRDSAEKHAEELLAKGGIVIVDRLPFIIVLGAGESGLLGQRLGGFVGFETAEELLFALGVGGLPQASITEHQIIVGLEIFRVDS